MSKKITPIPLVVSAGLGLLQLAVSSGCGGCVAPPEVTPVEVDPGDNAYVCACTCEGPGGAGSQTKEIQACVPAGLNTNIGGSAPTAADLQNDCVGRVEPLIETAAQSCVSSLANCACAAGGNTIFDVACDASCADEPLAEDCSNILTATSIDGSELVCRVPGSDPPVPTPEGILGGLAGRSSIAQVTSGQALVSIDGGSPQSTGISGSVTIIGGPCPEGGCGIGIGFQFDLGSIGFDGGFLDLGTVEFTNLEMSGATIPEGAVLDPDGNGSFAAMSMFVSGRGTATEYVLGIETDSETAGFTFTNIAPVDVVVDWIGHSFTMNTVFALEGGEDSPSVEVQAQVSGTISNQPPTADAGIDQVLECTSEAGVVATLDSSSSIDPENNILFRQWKQGADATGPEIGNDVGLEVPQALGTTASYFLTIIDDYLQIDNDITTVSVQDTTPPEVLEVVAPPCLWSPDHDYVVLRLDRDVQVTAQDTCDPAPVVEIVSAASDQPEDADGDGDGASSSDAVAFPDRVCLRTERQGADKDGRVYTVALVVRDGTGNESPLSIEIEVPHNQRPENRCDVDPESLEVVEEDDPLCEQVVAAAEEPAASSTVGGDTPSPHEGERQRGLAPSAPAPLVAVETSSQQDGVAGCRTSGSGPLSLLLIPILWVLRRRN